MNINNIRIATKIGISFAVVLGLLLIVGGIGYWGLSTADRDFGDYRAIARETKAIGLVESSLLESRVHVKNFMTSVRQEERAAADKSADEAKQRAKTLMDLAGQESGRQIARQLQSEIDEFMSDFGKAVAVRLAEREAADRLASTGPDAAKALAAIVDFAAKESDAESLLHANRMLSDLMQARVQTRKFEFSASDVDKQRSLDAIKSLRSHLEEFAPRYATGPKKDLFLALKSRVDAYNAAADAMFQSSRERQNLVQNSLDELGPQITRQIDEFMATNAARQDSLGPEAAASIHASKTTMTLAAVAALILGVGFAYLTGRGLAAPVKTMTSVMRRLAGGDLGVPIPATDRRDEIGEMAQAVQVFKDNACRVAELQRDQEQSQARIAEERKQAMRQLADSFETSVMGVVQAVSSSATEMKDTARTMAQVAQDGSSQAASVAAAAEQASANVQTVAAAAEELSASIGEIAHQVAEAARVAAEASEQVARTNDNVQALSGAASRIGEVVGLINDIASQTNLLALNATIEAARAGEAGKGFAVVAGEVKHLANQTAHATGEISGQVASVQEETRRAVEAIGRIGTVIEQVTRISSSMASAVEEQGAATREIARNVDEAASGTREVSSHIGGVTQSTAATGEAAEKVSSAAGELARDAVELREQVSRFLSNVRAG